MTGGDQKKILTADGSLLSSCQEPVKVKTGGVKDAHSSAFTHTFLFSRPTCTSSDMLGERTGRGRTLKHTNTNVFVVGLWCGSNAGSGVAAGGARAWATSP